ncbi:MAG TPA: heterodisulfide reductase-related iron-sulfur binding cluster [Gemmatimonadaceae bacterium]|nr:heterodisulfide reductase-related iron-sulfur binding cluster [Gemmatimonadaceae bacterium]
MGETPLSMERHGLDQCVHCGFCLQACPTYLATGDENDSPRGRIMLMRALVEGDLDVLDPAIDTHIGRCLGCRACETVCPSGVPYGHLLEATRATIVAERPIPLIGRIVLGVFASPRLLRIALFCARALRATRIPAVIARIAGRRTGGARSGARDSEVRRTSGARSGARDSEVRVPGPLAQASAMLAATEVVSTELVKKRAYRVETTSDRGTVALLRGCVMEGLFAETNRATERTLNVNGYRVIETPPQRCCGALHAHAGDAPTARALARANVAAFDASGAKWIAINAAGCGAMVKEYGRLLADDPAWSARAAAVAAKARDVSELLAAAGPLPGAPIKKRVTYDAPCHLLHAQRVADAPLAVLRAIPGMELVPLADADQCCGSAGIYNLLEPELAAQVLAPKLERIAESGAEWVATGNPGCLMQIGAGLLLSGATARAVHPVDLLDASYAARENPFT